MTNFQESNSLAQLRPDTLAESPLLGFSWDQRGALVQESSLLYSVKRLIIILAADRPWLTKVISNFCYRRAPSPASSFPLVDPRSINRFARCSHLRTSENCALQQLQEARNNYCLCFKSLYKCKYFSEYSCWRLSQKNDKIFTFDDFSLLQCEYY